MQFFFCSVPFPFFNFYFIFHKMNVNTTTEQCKKDIVPIITHDSPNSTFSRLFAHNLWTFSIGTVNCRNFKCFLIQWLNELCVEKRLIKITKNLSKKRRASCMRTNYDQTLLEQTKIFEIHTYFSFGRFSMKKPDFVDSGKLW